MNQDETAYETFYRTISEGELPTAVPVQSLDGRELGLCSGGMKFAHDQKARDIVMSPRPHDRAVAAIYALQRTAGDAEKYGVMASAHALTP